jgi:SAM-dependent methyltransferase
MPPMPTAAEPAAEPAPNAAHAALDAELKGRLARLARVFGLDALRAQAMGREQIVEYYVHTHDAYRKYHSAEGAVHMALNPDGRFDPAGYRTHLRLMERDWAAQAAAGRPVGDVLELAFGQAYNLLDLAAAHPGTHFTGIDMTPVHVELSRQRIATAGLANVTLTLGDFHHLPYPDASFDHVFCIEAFCYAQDLPRALSEIARVLRPGGMLTLFDGYTPRATGTMQAHEALGVDLAARGMALNRFQELDEMLATAAACGLALTRNDRLDREVRPSLARLERVTRFVLLWPWLGRRMLAKRHVSRGGNVLSGTLMRTLLDLGLLTYRHLVWNKPR